MFISIVGQLRKAPAKRAPQASPDEFRSPDHSQSALGWRELGQKLELPVNWIELQHFACCVVRCFCWYHIRTSSSDAFAAIEIASPGLSAGRPRR